ncbi:MAG TPA: hypothetical protein VK177_07215 [Flavobacteriales bacterium]|nr:hypothetical protein [Flavobacteriales bacterium]
MKYFVLFSCCLLAHVAFSQTIEMPAFPFVKLKTGQVITGNDMTFDSRVFGPSTVTIDGKLFKTRELSFIGDKSGQLHGRVGLDGMHPSVHNNRNIYTYKVVKTHYTPNNNYGVGPRYGGGGYYSTSINYYYSVGVVQMKRLLITNLVDDLKDDVVAMGDIYRGLKFRRVSQIAFLASTACLGYTFFSISNTGRLDQVPVYCALGGYVVSFGFYVAKWRMAQRAYSKYTGYMFY